MAEHIAGRARNADKLDVMEEHLHSISKVYPTLAAGVDVLAGAAWTLGNFVEIVPVNTITEDFDIHWLVIEGITASDIFELVIYAATTEISRVRFPATAGVGGAITFAPIPFLMPIQPKNTQIQAKLACSAGAQTATISVLYHTY